MRRLAASFEVSGPEFLAFFIVLAALACGAVVLLRWKILQGPADVRLESIGPQEAAFLNGGVALAILTSLAGLRRTGAIGTRPDGRLMTPGPLPADPTPLDTAIHDAARRHGMARDLVDDPAVEEALVDLYAGVDRLGLLLPPWRRRLARSAGLLLLPVIVLGAVRIRSGVAHDRPIGWVTFVSILLLVGMVVSVRHVPKATGWARQAVDGLKFRYFHLAPEHEPSFATYDVRDTAMAVALFGAPSLYLLDATFAADAGVRQMVAATTMGPTGAVGSEGASGCGGGCGGGGGGGGGGDGGGGGGGG
ncbi:TIGR04222 domain-containing membrane protein [Asanoa sp. NPDC050611]|uniref:TIGR04222 domain-containing membrane protein n=1 Tax=Asanoa sp. NPDC050611 TaxID=3157098 RepID=UPI0033F7DEEB